MYPFICSVTFREVQKGPPSKPPHVLGKRQNVWTTNTNISDPSEISPWPPVGFLTVLSSGFLLRLHWDFLKALFMLAVK